MREACIERIEKTGIVVIVRGVEREKLLPLAEAMYRGGIRALELTYDARGEVTDEETADRIRMLAEHFAGRMTIGAGTVLTEKQVRLTKYAGGEFIISPDANPDVIKATRLLGLVSIPGALTPTEIAAAYRAGADFVKLFPVTAFGPGYVKAVSAPLSHVRFLAVGGITEKNIPEYMAAGVRGIGVGSNIVDKALLEKEDYEGITAKAMLYTQLLEKLRK